MDLNIKSKRSFFGILFPDDPAIIVPFDSDCIKSLTEDIKRSFPEVEIQFFSGPSSQNIFSLPDRCMFSNPKDATRIIVKLRGSIILQILYMGYRITKKVGKIAIHDNSLNNREFFLLCKILYDNGYKTTMIRSSTKHRIYRNVKIGLFFLFLFIVLRANDIYNNTINFGSNYYNFNFYFGLLFGFLTLFFYARFVLMFIFESYKQKKLVQKIK